MLDRYISTDIIFSTLQCQDYMIKIAGAAFSIKSIQPFTIQITTIMIMCGRSTEF